MASEGKQINKFTRFRIKMKFGLSARISLYERLAAFLQSGIAVFEALDAIRARMEKRKDVRHIMIKNWLDAMKDGANLSDTMKDWIPTSEYMLISSGERGKGVISGLKEAAGLSLAAARIKKAIYAGAALPVLLLFMLTGMVAGFDIYMTPTFKSLLPIDKWPSDAKTLYNISHFITQYWHFVATALVVIGVLIGTTINVWVGRFRKIADNLPPWSIYKGYQASSFLISLASMLQAGIAFNDALKVLHKNASPWLKEHTEVMLNRMKKGGGNSGEALDTGLFEDEIAGDIIDYSRLASFEKAIQIIGERMIEEGVERTNQRMGVAKNLMLFLVAGTVLWVYYSSYTLQNTIADRVQSSK